MKEFNSQVCSTKEQSQRLLELGLKPETADMYYAEGSEDAEGDIEYHLRIRREWEDLLRSNDIPAWSLHRLIEMLDIYIEYSPYTGFNNIGNNSLYDDLINLVEDRIIKKLFNKEYLK